MKSGLYFVRTSGCCLPLSVTNRKPFYLLVLWEAAVSAPCGVTANDCYCVMEASALQRRGSQLGWRHWGAAPEGAWVLYRGPHPSLSGLWAEPASWRVTAGCGCGVLHQWLVRRPPNPR